MNETAFKAVIGTLVVVFSLILGPIWSGYVLTILWGWFMVPAFSLPVLHTANAIGLCIVVRYLTWQLVDCQEPKRDAMEKVIRSAMFAFGSPAFGLAFGWIVHKFV